MKSKLRKKVAEQKNSICQLSAIVAEQRCIIAGLLEAVNGRTKTMEEVEREMLSSPAADVTNPTTELDAARKD